MEIGPLQLVAIGFTDPKLDGSLLNALADASDAGHIRIVDLLGVYKGADGSVLAAEATDLTQDEAMTYGAWVGALIGLGAGGAESAEMGALLGAMSAADEYEYGIDAEGIRSIAADIPLGGAAMLLVLEHRWAISFRNAARASGGILIAQDFLNPEALIEFGADIALEG
jgi:uncharacterized membrane protein